MKTSPVEPTVQDLYEQDFFEWTALNAELLRAVALHVRFLAWGEAI